MGMAVPTLYRTTINLFTCYLGPVHFIIYCSRSHLDVCLPGWLWGETEGVGFHTLLLYLDKMKQSHLWLNVKAWKRLRQSFSTILTWKCPPTTDICLDSISVNPIKNVCPYPWFLSASLPLRTQLQWVVVEIPSCEIGQPSRPSYLISCLWWPLSQGLCSQFVHTITEVIISRKNAASLPGHKANITQPHI